MNEKYDCRTIQSSDVGLVEQTLRATRTDSLRRFANQLGSELPRYSLAQLHGAVAEHGGLYAAHASDQPVAVAQLAPLNWDSQVFGRAMGVIQHTAYDPVHAVADCLETLVRRVRAEAESRGMEFLLCKVFADDNPLIHALERCGFLLVDTVLDYDYHYPSSDLSAERLLTASDSREVTIRQAKSFEGDEISAVARAAFSTHFGRFNADPRLADDAGLAYGEWVHSSLAGYADWFFVAVEGSKIVGYSVWRKPSEAECSLSVRIGHYSICAVHPEFSGRGLFQQLTQAGIEALRGQVDVVEGPTHVLNHPVQRAYSRMGWRNSDARHSFHCWLSPA